MLDFDDCFGSRKHSITVTQIGWLDISGKFLLVYLWVFKNMWFLSFGSVLILSLTCKSNSNREDVYRVVKAFIAQGGWMSSEVKRFAQYLV